MYYVPWHFFFKRLNKNFYCTYLNMILRKINLNHFQFLEVVENHKSQCCNFDTKILYIFGRCCRNQGGWNLRMKIWVHFTRRAFTQCQILFLVISRILLKVSLNCCESHTQLYFTFSALAIKVSKFQKPILLFSLFEPKNEQNYFLISTLASKMGEIKKMKALYYIN